jgi:putative DNA-invertase from lambdoid prophage Rac
VRAAVYHRVSTLDQHPEAARAELEAHAARLGAEVVLCVEEKASGGRNDRAGLQRVLRAAERGEIEAVLVWKLDRWGRSVLDVLANVRRLEVAGVRLVVTTQGLDIRPDGDAVSRLTLTILGAVAEFERSLIRERTLLGLARARRKGRVGGRPRSHDVDAAAVRRLRAEGKSWAQVELDLGVPSWAARRAVGALKDRRRA